MSITRADLLKTLQAIQSELNVVRLTIDNTEDWTTQYNVRYEYPITEKYSEVFYDYMKLHGYTKACDEFYNDGCAYEELSDNEYAHKVTLQYHKAYFMITFTFQPKVSVNLDDYGQTYRLKECFSMFNMCQYFACIEKHKSGIQHGHMLIQTDLHSIYPLLNKCKKILTTAVHLEPAIVYKVVKQTQLDVERSFSYIWSHKDDHPFFKYVFINNKSNIWI